MMSWCRTMLPLYQLVNKCGHEKWNIRVTCQQNWAADLTADWSLGRQQPDWIVPTDGFLLRFSIDGWMCSKLCSLCHMWIYEIDDGLNQWNPWKWWGIKIDGPARHSRFISWARNKSDTFFGNAWWVKPLGVSSMGGDIISLVSRFSCVISQKLVEIMWFSVLNQFHFFQILGSIASSQPSP